HDALPIFARQSGVSIRCDAPIAGTVTVNLRGVAVDEAFTRILGPRSAVFVYANNAATDRQPRLVEVRIYADQAAWSRSPATSPDDRPWPAEAGENLANLAGADRTRVHSSNRTEHRPAAALRPLTPAPSGQPGSPAQAPPAAP